MTKDYPSLIDCFNKDGKLPQKLTFSLAALLVLYKGTYNRITFEIKDTPELVDLIQTEWKKPQETETLVKNILSNAAIWKKDLTQIEGLIDQVAVYVKSILNNGIKQAIQNTLSPLRKVFNYYKSCN